MFTYLGVLLFSMEGRIARKRFWFGLLLLAAISIGLALTAGPFAAQILTAYLAVCVFSKRLHDRGKPATAIYLFYVVTVIDAALIKSGMIEHTKVNFSNSESFIFTVNMIKSSNIVYGILGWATAALDFIITIYLFIQCGILKGISGENKFGSDPTAVRTHD